MKTVNATSIVIISMLCMLAARIPAHAGQPLSFEQRVKAQKAIERVYYNHRIWPKENPQPKPPFEQMVPKSVIEAKVTGYLKKCAALDKYWQRPIQPEQLQAEMDRMARQSKDPATLKELLAALGNDPILIAECLARPVLADRLIHDWYANDERFHKETRQAAEEALRAISPDSLAHCKQGEYHRTIFSVDQRGVQSPPRQHERDADVLQVTPSVLSRQLRQSPPEGEISGVKETATNLVIVRTVHKSGGILELESLSFPKRSLDAWLSSVHLAGALPGPAAESFALPAVSESSCAGGWYNGILDDVPVERDWHTAVWTGSEMIVWGGLSYDGSTVYLNSGGRYSPSTDSWAATSTGVNCPSPRFSHTAIWTGAEMIVWGGYFYDTSIRLLNTGGRYDPSTNTWTAISTGTNCPPGRDRHTAVWTGSQMIVWGGEVLTVPYTTNTGGRYNPSADSWASTSTSGGCPSVRCWHSAVWTGQVMIVWGGSDNSNFLNTGGRYDPSTNGWAATSAGTNCPVGRFFHTAVWTGSEMIVWGGEWQDPNYHWENTGGRYNPSTNSWTATSTGAGCPAARELHTAVWTGSEMIIWGGGPDYLQAGGRYNPSGDSWTATSTGANCPRARETHSAVWTGSEMIVWGGDATGGSVNTGGRYNPSADSWLPTSIANSPSGRQMHTAIWTGSEMIIWGGEWLGDVGYNENTGGRYSPSTDSWLPTSTGGDCPSARSYHTAVWTGSEMIVWGGIAGGAALSTGGRYSPADDGWIATPVGADGPSPRCLHSAVWTGTEMIVWGGRVILDGYGTNTGGRFDPVLGAWSSTSIGANCPSLRESHTAIWTGSEMIVWGGQGDTYPSYLNTGARYDPSGDYWTATSTGADCPSGRARHTAVWTGSAMIAWGGYTYDASGHRLNTGGRYTPSTDSWTPTSTDAGCPSGRESHTAVWTGSEMIVWGGFGDALFNSGGLYDPSADLWAATPTGGDCPIPRSQHTAVWAGSQMIVWGGVCANSLSSGGRYDPYPLPPIAPSSPSFAGVACTSQIVNWALVPHAASYDVWRATGSSCSGAAKITATPIERLSCNDTGGIPGTQYSYYVTANNACGTSANGACASSATLPRPAAPAAPTFTAITTTTLTVDWSGVADATNYDVWRANGASCSGAVKITSTAISGFSFTDTGRSPNFKYSYFVTANGVCGASSNGACASVTTLSGTTPGEVSPGSTPTTAIIWNANKTALSWQSTLLATGYRLYRGTPASLPNLLTAATDSCNRYDGPALTVNLNGANDVPAPGSFLWFLITAHGATMEGTAGWATSGQRIVNSTGVCP